MARSEYHVVPDGNGWKVEQGAAVIGLYDTKDGAVEEGRKVAQAHQPGQLVVHTSDRKIEKEFTYQDDPYPPAG